MDGEGQAKRNIPQRVWRSSGPPRAAAARPNMQNYMQNNTSICQYTKYERTPFLYAKCATLYAKYVEQCAEYAK